jgi:hypothetical protein
MADKQTKPAAEPVFTHKLLAPVHDIQSDEMLEELSFREPTARDIIRHGVPVKWNLTASPPTPEFDPKSMREMLAACSGRLPFFFDNLKPQDFMALCWGLAPFFLPNVFEES